MLKVKLTWYFSASLLSSRRTKDMKYGRIARTSIIFKPPFRNLHLLLAATNLVQKLEFI